MDGTFRATFRESNGFTAHFAEGNAASADFGEVQFVQVADWYEGEYTFVPTEQTQIIPTKGKSMAQDIVIQAIPSNYGRIVWNGSTLTVS